MAATKTNPNNLRVIRSAWSRVKVTSLADGSLHVKPVWKQRFKRPGVFTRMFTAQQLQSYLNGKIKHG